MSRERTGSKWLYRCSQPASVHSGNGFKLSTLTNNSCHNWRRMSVRRAKGRRAVFSDCDCTGYCNTTTSWLLLHGEKPPEVTCKTLFCYIAVQVTVALNHDAHNPYPHPPYHMESKPCKQGKLTLTFTFHQPGIMCVIQLSVHSIADSGGVEYMHHSDNCTCVVQGGQCT